MLRGRTAAARRRARGLIAGSGARAAKRERSLHTGTDGAARLRAACTVEGRSHYR